MPDSKHQEKAPLPVHGARRRRFLATLAALAVLAPLPSRAQARRGPEDFARDLGEKVIRLARSPSSDAQLKRQFLKLLTSSADIRAVARFALGKYRRRMPKKLMNEYYRLVLDYIAGLFVWYRKDLAAREIRVQGTSTRGQWATVKTALIFDDGASRPVLWRIHVGGARYRVGDLNIRGIWLSLRMRDKFVSILNESGGDFGALMRYLRENSV